MGARVDAFKHRGITRAQKLKCFGATGRKACTLPDLVEAARIAVIAGEDLLAWGPQPAGEPDVDGVGLRQWPAGENWQRAVEENDGHGFNRATRLDAGVHEEFIAQHRSKVMAAPTFCSPAVLMALHLVFSSISWTNP